MTASPEVCTPNTILDRMTLVLDAFDGPGRLTLAQVVRRTGLPRSSAHRLLERLVQLRWLRRQGRDYELGMRLVELGSVAVQQDRLFRAAAPFLYDLHRGTGLVVHLAVLDGPDVVYLAKVGDRWGGAIPTRLGGRHPAHCTAVGKAILAFSDGLGPGQRDEHPLTRMTKYSISTGGQLEGELAKVRDRGVAYEQNEAFPGFGCVAAAIGEPGEVVGAVSVCGPVDQMRYDHRLAAPARTTALSVWRNIMHGGAGRVRPILQHARLLDGRPAPDRAGFGARSHTLQTV